ncbi:MAG: glycosyltransferase family 4 protein [Armatimonadota bacterium]|nr:glycosyltransferase family 4 protein [Armatimonadota bacterium]
MTREQKTKPTLLLHVVTVPETFTFLGPLVNYTRSRGWEVRAVSSPGEQLAALANSLGAPVYTVEMMRQVAPGSDLKALWRLVRVMRNLRPDVVHAHTPKGGLLGTMAARLARVPAVIYHIHGLPSLTASGSKRILLRASEKISCCLADQVLCVSCSCRDAAVQVGVCAPDKICVPANGSICGVDAQSRFNPDRLPRELRSEVRDRLGIPGEALVVGYVGRIVRDKGIAELVRAWELLREKYSQLHLLLVGPFEPQDPIPAAAEEVLRNDPRVHLAGLDWDTPKYYAAMDIFVLPSYREGFGLAALEAAAMALPVVATDIPGCRDAVQSGVTGKLVEPKSVDQLTAALQAYIDDPELRYVHGQAGRARAARDFQPEQVCEATFREYERLLARKRFQET